MLFWELEGVKLPNHHSQPVSLEDNTVGMIPCFTKKVYKISRKTVFGNAWPSHAIFILLKNYFSICQDSVVGHEKLKT